jgi:hypothetical protein
MREVEQIHPSVCNVKFRCLWLYCVENGSECLQQRMSSRGRVGNHLADILHKNGVTDLLRLAVLWSMFGKRARPALFKVNFEQLRRNFICFGQVENFLYRRRQIGEFCLEAASASVFIFEVCPTFTSWPVKFNKNRSNFRPLIVELEILQVKALDLDRQPATHSWHNLHLSAALEVCPGDRPDFWLGDNVLPSSHRQPSEPEPEVQRDCSPSVTNVTRIRSKKGRNFHD